MTDYTDAILALSEALKRVDDANAMMLSLVGDGERFDDVMVFELGKSAGQISRVREYLIAKRRVKLARSQDELPLK